MTSFNQTDIGFLLFYMTGALLLVAAVLLLLPTLYKGPRKA